MLSVSETVPNEALMAFIGLQSAGARGPGPARRVYEGKYSSSLLGRRPAARRSGLLAATGRCRRAVPLAALRGKSAA